MLLLVNNEHEMTSHKVKTDKIFEVSARYL